DAADQRRGAERPRQRRCRSDPGAAAGGRRGEQPDRARRPDGEVQHRGVRRGQPLDDGQHQELLPDAGRGPAASDRDMSFKALQYERRGGAVWLWLNRPDALNALDPTLIGELLAACDRAEGESGLAALVLSGRGRAFCAGADLKHILTATDDTEGLRRFV